MRQFLVSHSLRLFVGAIILGTFLYIFFHFFFQKCSFVGIGPAMICTCKGILVERETNKLTQKWDDPYFGTYKHCLGIVTERKTTPWRGF